MLGAKRASAGHGLSDGRWLDVHFECARAEYEESLRQVGVEAGWTALDAGCSAGLLDISRQGWLVERWGPAPPATRAFVEAFLPRWAELAAEHGIPAADVEFWSDLAANPGRMLDDPDFCHREFFVIATGRVSG